MLEIGARLLERGDAIILSGRAEPEACELREDEPHPVALLGSGLELGEGGVDDALLGIEKTLEIVGIAHTAFMAFGAPAEKSRPRLLVRREKPRQHIEEDHYRASQQSERDQPEADNRRIDAAVVGQPGGDAHHLGVAAVDQETSVHLSSFCLEWFRRSAARWRPKRAGARKGTHRR